MNPVEHSPLGKTVAYRDDYDPTLLYPIPRVGKRAEIGLAEALPFHGVDIWNAYELSWLDPKGKPHVAIAEFRIPAQSPNIIESKSFKLYLNSFAQTHLVDAAELVARMTRDLSAAAGAPVAVEVFGRARFSALGLSEPAGECIDELDIAIHDYGPPRADYLAADDSQVVDETLVSHLLKSNCPVTGQPDWASVQVAYRGPRIDREGLLRYLVGFRRHNDFHEQCVERVFMDISRRCAPQALTVYARYTRRGGLDINPWRSTEPGVPPNDRTARQ
ncbi:NADPH-dependent 7-cyano-7-deazaguanine reductase QueF [Tahibacter amnicola]|uniref:NADPH-dependent 7-cyano-7-deazaguanine reductase n=1 Tax=Tahibacter amnicola TaxID=2976241 RepID=A0ABY6BHQ5_9GAMM|nr:NADPH-dependent 7-cyano-7-deazaguanine reductase QueF [Tahibacter amnicola]UXI68141.1 NADPH-dependent 7-cyano-7-deazaguanine reductase QueF [Tahibacter amnicola]